MRVDREVLLQELQSVEPGLSPREIVEQSSCFVFRGGRVITYNDEVACSCKCSLATEEMEGAVQAEKLIAILQKMPEEQLDVEVNEEELVLLGKKRKAGIRMEKEILLPVDMLETPAKGSWHPLPDNFSEALGMVQNCAGKDESQFILTCIHVHPKWLEACDDFQVARFRMQLPIKGGFLVRRASIKHITNLGVTDIAETDAWVHFRNPSGLVVSCRRWVDEYPSVSDLLKADGEPTVLPKGLADAVERSEVFSSDNPEENEVTITLRAGRMSVRGQGTSGWFQEHKKVKYNGSSISFLIAPQLLIDLTKNHYECQVSSDRLKVSSGKFTYVTCLGKATKEAKETE